MKVGVIGGGHWGKNLVRNFAEIGVLAGVADPVEGNRSRALEEAPGIELFAKEKDLLAAGYDAVAIATPAATHYGIARKALELDLDVFVEKPVTLDAAEALELHGLAEKREQVCDIFDITSPAVVCALQLSVVMDVPRRCLKACLMIMSLPAALACG